MSNLSIELSRSALRVGEPVLGLVALTAAAPLRLRRLTVRVAGIELIGTAARYRPAVYRYPVPRPWGRTRTGARRVDFELEERLVAEQTAVEPGRHGWPFALNIPPDALPTYGGAGVLVEHEVSARAEFDNAPSLSAWSPLHLWAAPGPPGPAEAFRLVAPMADPPGLLDRLTARLRAPLSLQVTGPSSTLALGSTTVFEYEVENPEELDLRHLTLGLEATETTRHRAATDVGRFVVDEREIRLAPSRRARGEIEWTVPALAAPTLRSPRFSVRWELTAAVTVPWTPGISGRAELTLVEAPD